MAQNKGAIVRYRAIDRCLRSKHGKYGIEELRAACAEALYDAFSERMTVSRRQIFLDFNHMESNAGYRAEIEHYRDGKKMYYRYADPDFSIEKTPISSEEMNQLKETILMLNRFKGMPHFVWMEEILSKLEDKFRLKGSDDSVIGFEQNLDLKGLENITPLFDAIVNKQVLNIRYKSFKKNKPLHPSQHNYDKEYRISIDVIPNNELIALLLSFGSQLEVLEPQSVRDMMRDHVKTLKKFYR